MLLELLSPERIAAFGVAFTSVVAVWVKREARRVKKLEAQVRRLEEQQKVDRGVIRTCVRYIRAQGVHIALLCGLLRQHAPHVDIPAEPQLPDELIDEV